MTQKLTPEFQFQQAIIDLYHSGTPASQLAKDYGVSVPTIYKWTHKIRIALSKSYTVIKVQPYDNVFSCHATEISPDFSYKNNKSQSNSNKQPTIKFNFTVGCLFFTAINDIK
ncbi:helix-turn-helix domain-containing protein [Leuconostoc sp. MS02]|uniref:Helix-turn-helix domain-containing protein n=1 Tax=Leuconostoc aquikimchii TaxID=3236804 RepID=A0ABV3S585_9LACO